MKTSHFESGIAQGAARAATMRDEPTLCESATFYRHAGGQGLSSRKIARELDVDRETVRRYRPAPDSKPPFRPPARLTLSNQLQMVFPTSGNLSESIVHELIKAANVTNRTANAVTNDIRSDLGK